MSIEETWTGHPPARPHSHTFLAKRRLKPRDRGAALFLWQTGHQGVLTFLFTQECHHPSNIGKEPGLHPVSLFNYKNSDFVDQEPNADEVAKGDAGLQVPDLNIT